MKLDRAYIIGVQNSILVELKKVVLLAFVLLLLSMLGAWLVMRRERISGSTIHHVYPGQSIQDAVNLAQRGDTITVHAGTYYEHVVVNKTVSLVGENKYTTIIDGGAVQYDVIYVTSNNVTISNFTLQKGGRGIYPDRHGIYLYSSNSNNIRNNIIRNNVEGIFVCMSNNNIFKNNGVHTNNLYGIWIYSSSNNIITGNTISNNGKYGMILQGDCSNNLIFHNNLIRNKHKNLYIATTGVCANTWDDSYPSGGNHWSNYNSTDVYSGPYQNETASDGIADTAHGIDDNNQDNYPLMGMFSDFNATSEYHVQTICNSPISDFQFNGTAICFNVTDKNETLGFCRICIQTALMSITYKVYVNGTIVSYDLLPCSNSTHSYIYFTYLDSTHKIEIIPEFPTWASMLIMLIVLTLAIAIPKRRLLRTPT